MGRPLSAPKGKPRNRLLHELRRRWMEAQPGRRSADLAEQVGVTPRAISNFVSGSSGHLPPWNLVLWLLGELRAELRVTEAGLVLTTRRGGDGLATRSDDFVILFDGDDTL